jgi:hypothetical protein
MNTCETMRLLISRNIDGDIDGSDSARLAAHLETCTACALVARRFAAQHALLTDAKPSVSPALSRIPVELLSADRRPAGTGNVFKHFPVYRYALAAALIISIGVIPTVIMPVLHRTVPVSRAAKTDALRLVAGIDGRSQVNLPLGTLFYYAEKKPDSAVLLQYSSVGTAPLSSFVSSGESDLGTTGYDSPFFNE